MALDLEVILVDQLLLLQKIEKEEIKKIFAC